MLIIALYIAVTFLLVSDSKELIRLTFALVFEDLRVEVFFEAVFADLRLAISNHSLSLNFIEKFYMSGHENTQSRVRAFVYKHDRVRNA